MRTDKQKQTSRTNGAKSHGPNTPEGKAKSAYNAARHNLCTGHLVLLSNEDPRDFHRLQDDYLIRFQPIDGVELDLVNKMIAATWREKRVTAMESALFELEMFRQQADVDDEFSEISAPARQTLALFGTEDTKAAAALLYRYGSTARRAYSAGFRALKELQGDRFNRSSPPVPLSPNATTHNGADAPSASSPTHETLPSPAPSASTSIRNAAVASFIILRRRAARVMEPKNTELPNEPKRAIAAGQPLLAALLDN